MTEMISEIEAIRVHIAGSDVPLAPRQKPVGLIRSTFATFGTTKPVVIANIAATRKRLIVTQVVAGVAIIANSLADAMESNGAQLVLNEPFYLLSQSEVWLTGDGDASVSVVQEFAT